MKYLLTAASILAALCLGLLIAPLLSTRVKPTEGSLVVNQRIFPPQELEERLQTTSYHYDSDSEQLTTLIYRELLLQEAKHLKIDTESSFLHSMRDFYEQSMIKTLLDRQYSLKTHQPNASQVAACQPLLTRVFNLKEIEYPDHAAALANTSGHTESYNLPYLELPEDIRSSLYNLKGSELSAPVHAGSIWVRLQLIDITPIPEKTIPSPLEQEELCRDELKRQSIQSWVEGLYYKSKIEVPAGIKGGSHG